MAFPLSSKLLLQDLQAKSDSSLSDQLFDTELMQEQKEKQKSGVQFVASIVYKFKLSGKQKYICYVATVKETDVYSCQFSELNTNQPILNQTKLTNFQ